MSRRSARRVVIDTNVLLDLWLFDDPSVRTLRRAIQAGSLRPLRCAQTDAELVEVLQRAQFALDAATRVALLDRWITCSELLVNVTAAPVICSDADDQKFLDAAFSGGADLLLTRDKALLALAGRAGALGLHIERPTAAVSYDEPHSVHVASSAASASCQRAPTAGDEPADTGGPPGSADPLARRRFSSAAAEKVAFDAARASHLPSSRAVAAKRT